MTLRDRQQPDQSGPGAKRFHGDGLASAASREADGQAPASVTAGLAVADVPVPNVTEMAPGVGRRTSRKAGFTLGEIMTVAGIIGLVAGIAIPSFVRAREQSQLKSIINNLRIIEAAKDTYALENRKGTGSTTSLTAIQSYLKGGTVKLVINETYTTGNIGTAASAKAPVALGTYTAKKKITSP